MKKSIFTRFLAVLSAVTLIISLTGCGSSKEANSDKPTGPAITDEITAPAAPTDSAPTSPEDDPDDEIAEGYIGTVEYNGSELPLFISGGLSFCFTEDKEAVVLFTLFTDDSLESYTIPESIEYEGTVYPVTAIDSDAFSGFTEIVSVIVPSSVKTIGDSAFDGCDKLETVFLSEGVETLGESVFNGCSALKSITLPSSVKEIGESLFFDCTSLETAVLSENMAVIPTDTFSNCESLNILIIPSSVTVIGDEAFWNCPALTSVQLSEGLQAIGNRAFYNCSSLPELTFPASLVSIGEDLFEYCDSLTILRVPSGSKRKYEDRFEGSDFEIVEY